VDEATLFVVRVWRQRGAFRATTRRVDDEDTRLFVAVAELAAFLEASAARTGDDPRPAVPSSRRDPSG
jgi:hypothetical protein